MDTLTLCQDVATGTYLLEVSDHAGDLRDLFHISGENANPSRTWERLAWVGEQEDVDDTDAFWVAIDNAISWVAAHRGNKLAWQVCQDAYAGTLDARDMAGIFRELRRGTTV